MTTERKEQRMGPLAPDFQGQAATPDLRPLAEVFGRPADKFVAGGETWVVYAAA